MSTNILALGLDPEDVQLEGLRGLGYTIESCLVDSGETAETVTKLHLDSRTFDCVLIGAALRAPPHLLLFEKLLNLVHARAPLAKICFNTTPADSADAVQRWV